MIGLKVLEGLNLYAVMCIVMTVNVKVCRALIAGDAGWTE